MVRRNMKKQYRVSIFITVMNKNCGKRALIRAPIPITCGDRKCGKRLPFTKC
jgi:hypothetical protein